MPRGDRTGPLGEGPMTGLRRGLCADNDVGFGRGFGFGRDFGRGFGFGRGIGRGFGGRWFSGTSTQSEESELTNSISALKEQLRILESRLNSLKNKD